MRTAVLFPDVVTPTGDYLQAALDADAHDYADGTLVRTREPNPFPIVSGAGAPLVVLRRSGGVPTGVIGRPRVDALVWHRTDPEARDLSELVMAYLTALPGVRSGHTVYTATPFSGPSLIWDAGRDLPRYLLTVEVGIRGSAL